MSETNHLHESILHEKIVMPDLELPIRFHHHTHDAKGAYVILHWHSQLEMVYVKKGTIKVGCNEGMVELHPSEILFINSNEPHSYYIVENPIELYCCTIDLIMFKGRYVTSFDPQYISSYVIFQNKIEDQEIVEYFLSMWDEHYTQERGYEYAIKANLFHIMALMLRRHIQSTITEEQFLNKNRNLRNINKIINYIEEHYSEDITLDELADCLNFNRYYFCRLFKEITGLTPIKYINNYRVHQAISLMQHTDMTVAQISSEVGFNNPNYFTRVFKEATNKTPSVYMREIKK